MKTLTFVRHAESVANAGGVTMPHAAIPLSALGCLQALELAAAFSTKPSAVVVSGMVRTHQTAAPTCERFGLIPQVQHDLDEFSVIDPSLIEGLDGSQRKPLVKAYWDSADPHRRLGKNADTFAEFDARVSTFLTHMDSLPDRAVIFGHGIWFGLLLWRMQGRCVSNSAGMLAFRHFQLGLPMPNCAVYTLHGRGGHWEAQADIGIAQRIERVQFEPGTFAGI